MSAYQDNNRIVRTGHTIEIRVAERQNPKKLAELREVIVDLSGGQACDILADVSRSKIATAETRAAAEDFFKGLSFRRFAIFGGSPPINLSLKTLVEEHTDSEKVRIFRREADARAWLEEPNH